MRAVSFPNAVAPTRLARWTSKFFVYVDTRDRDSGESRTVRFAWNIPASINASRDMWIDWIRWCVKYAWVHELDEALFVDGKRRHDLHDGHGNTIPHPDDAGDAWPGV